MDIKAPLEKYPEIVCAKIDTSKIQKSIKIIKDSDINYEFRTTVVKSQLLPEDFEQIVQMIKGEKKYYLQKFVPSKLVDEKFKNAETYSDEEFKKITENIKKYVQKIEIR